MREELIARIRAIEEGYEFMLAYAAQGLPGDAGSQSGGELRTFLDRAAAAVDGLGAVFSSLVEGDRLEPASTFLAFRDVLDRDARAALAAIELVRVQRSIGSQLIDNLNASIHVRALLTDLFLLDELLVMTRDQRSGIGDQAPG
jgi:hypothetical protein